MTHALSLAGERGDTATSEKARTVMGESIADKAKRDPVLAAKLEAGRERYYGDFAALERWADHGFSSGSVDEVESDDAARYDELCVLCGAMLVGGDPTYCDECGSPQP